MTCGALSSVAGGEGEEYRFGRMGGPRAASIVGLELSPRPFSSFSFLFWFYLKTFANKPYLIQTNFEICRR
jgi:hypothetical protein